MKVYILKEKDINKRVAGRFIRLINKKENPVIGLATGSTPEGVYNELIKAFKKGIVSFKNTISFNLDEYLDLKDEKYSYRSFMNEKLINHIDIKQSFMPTDNYDDLIKAKGGIDIQLLGIGRDGHIAFNEPGTDFDSLTHIANIAEMTRIDNQRFFENGDKVPERAITMGLKTIMHSKRIILIAFGKNKADAVAKMINGPIHKSCPASILQKHPHVEIFIDEDAASLL